MAAEKIDMSLDDIIKMDGISGNKRGKGTAGGARRGAGNSGTGGRTMNTGNRNTGNRGAIRNQMNRSSNRATPYSRTPNRVPDKWQHDKFDGPTNGSNHLLVSNLDYGVSDKDVQDLFVEFGPLRKAAVHYDKSGRSLGTADVIFVKREHAIAAMKKYNGVLLDGRSMKITLVPSASDGSQRRSAPSFSGSSFRSPRPVNSSRVGGSGQRNRGGGRGGKMGNRGSFNQNRKPLTVEDLDADLEAYVSK